ncbi:prephenate dehydrogenase [Streptomyces sp. NBC_00094]|uniref:prephenate dehydrogenase n=1 Tax=Streptomyces sp. NBC_00094 TaxID=2903620 RepID=UPI002252FF93|nr:prephenate dehydrogenase [Streptomyces sp. NBC_00094]MCX5394401.1 prephenate dehydrogenase [Streptomyces sp. NBC_00094]
MFSAAVVGTGLIGTSIALALRDQGVVPHLLDRDPESARTAADLGAGVVGFPREPVDLAVIAVPPQHVALVLKEHQLLGLAHDFTDVASVKDRPQREAAELGCDLSRFVGGHPMGGREQSGPLAAQRGLFHGRPWVLTPSAASRESAVDRVKELAELCGAHPVVMTQSDHDRAVALTSHAPHVVATLLAARLLSGDDCQLRLSGQGLRDTTRIASGDPGLWTDILGSNAGAVADVLTEFASDLQVVVEALRDLGTRVPEQPHTSTAQLTSALVRGVQGRARVPAPASGGLHLSGAAAHG